jgi:hypothetical protein
MKPVHFAVLIAVFVCAIPQQHVTPFPATGQDSPVPQATPTAPGRTFLNLYWTASFEEGRQDGPLVFPPNSTAAVLTVIETLAGRPYHSPYHAVVVGKCATVSPTTSEANFTITRGSQGTCTLVVTDSNSGRETLQVTSP